MANGNEPHFHVQLHKQNQLTADESYRQGQYFSDYPVNMADALLAVIPLNILFATILSC